MNLESEGWKPPDSQRPTEAYSPVVEMDSTQPNPPETAIQPYWLLALHPESDSSASRHYWLAATLTRARLDTPALELYKRELEANPEAGLSKAYGKLLKIQASAGNLLWIARQRLAAAGHKRLWPVIQSDLNVLSGRAAELDEASWLSFLAGALAYLCFDRPARVYEHCLELLAGLQHLEFRESRVFEQIEKVQKKAEIWRGATDLPVPLREVVRDAWGGSATAWKKTMIRAAEWAADDPVATLEKFDRAIRTPECRLVFSSFQSLLKECRPF